MTQFIMRTPTEAPTWHTVAFFIVGAVVLAATLYALKVWSR